MTQIFLDAATVIQIIILFFLFIFIFIVKLSRF